MGGCLRIWRGFRRNLPYAPEDGLGLKNGVQPAIFEYLLLGEPDRLHGPVGEREIGETENDRQFDAEVTHDEIPCGLFRHPHLNRLIHGFFAGAEETRGGCFDDGGFEDGHLFNGDAMDAEDGLKHTGGDFSARLVEVFIAAV